MAPPYTPSAAVILKARWTPYPVLSMVAGACAHIFPVSGFSPINTAPEASRNRIAPVASVTSAFICAVLIVTAVAVEATVNAGEW